MGTVATFAGSETLFELTLRPWSRCCETQGMSGTSSQHDHQCRGDLATRVHLPLWLPRLAVLEPLQALGWGELLALMISRDKPDFDVQPGFSLCVVLTTPPFPYSRHQVEAAVGLPLLIGDIPAEHLHFGEVAIADGQLVTSGLYGWTAVVTGTGATVQEARDHAYGRARQVQAPSLRYRLDIGATLIAGDLEKLVGWGWLKSMPESRIASQIVR